MGALQSARVSAKKPTAVRILCYGDLIMTYFLSYPGLASQVSCFGGTPYFLAEGLRTIGEDAVGLDLPLGAGLARRRVLWNAKQMLLGRGRGGFQYSKTYFDRVWRAAPQLGRDDVLISLFQIIGERAWAMPGRKAFYLDMTLRQLFSEYGTEVSARSQREAIATETRGYARADKVICTSAWTARSLTQDYGVDPAKVHVVVRGANLPGAVVRDLLAQPQRAMRADGEALRFLFIGKEPVRKGLVRFLEGVELLGDLREQIVVEVVGCDPDELGPRFAGWGNIVHHGFVNKTRDVERFCGILRGADVGILLSTAEAGGISLREFQLAGMPVMSPNVGGSPEWVAGGAGVLVEREDDAAAIAGKIRGMVEDRAGFMAMREAVARARGDMTWIYAASAIRDAFIKG